jgi:uncharacterized protein involved in exopolysaccharide biosynthesis
MATATRRFELASLARKAWARRMALLGFHLAVAAIATAVVFLLPRWYAASVTLVPAPGAGLALEVPGGLLPGTSLRLGAGPTPQDELAMVLSSRTIVDALVTRFDLVRRWNASGPGQARRMLLAHRTVATPRQGEVVLTVESRDPALARDLAAGFVDLAASESLRLRDTLHPTDALGPAAPAFAVLDAATLPESPVRPQRALTVVLALVLALAGSLVGLHFDDEERGSWLLWQPRVTRGGRAAAERKAA